MQHKPLSIFVILFLLVSCAPKVQNNPGIQPISKDSEPSYNNLDQWAAHPSKPDPSDSLPAALRVAYKPDTSAAVFFLHPTTFTDRDSPYWNGDLSSEALNNKTDRTTIHLQASAFNRFPLYAPRYRQANIKSYFTTDTATALAAFDLAYTDVKNAFEEFLKQIGPSKPFIIAAHSQGSTHAINLLKEFVDGKPLQSRLVAAYIIGMRIPDDFTSLKMCSDSSETGCLIGWRTYRKGYVPEFVQKETGKAMVTNPLTWTTTEERAPASLNKGVVLKDLDRTYPASADATISGRVLWVSSLNFPGGFLIRRKNLHIGDINLFWMNIRENTALRVKSYLKSNSYGASHSENK